jgi:hypothetical protein
VDRPVKPNGAGNVLARERARADWLKIMRDLRTHADEMALAGKPAAETAARALVARAWRELHKLKRR